MARDKIQQIIRWGVAGMLLSMPVTAAAQTLLRSLEAEIDALVRRAEPAVVTVYANVPHEEKNESLFSFFDDDEEHAHDSLAHYTRVGTGLLLSEEGYIATRSSIVAQACSVQVKLYDGRETQADVIGLDERLGVALLYIGAAGITPVAFGDPDGLHPGSWAFVLGNSLGHFPAVTMGTVNVKHDNGHLQIAVMLTPGNNGSPVLNADGEIIGMISGAIDFSGENGEAGTPFESVLVLPVDQVLASAEKLLEHYAAQQGWLGITVRPHDTSSPQIFKIAPGSPAEKAGLQIGDIITAVNGQKLSDYFALKYHVRKATPGDEITLDVQRDSRALQVTMTAGVMPYQKAFTAPAERKAAEQADELGAVSADASSLDKIQRQKLEKRLRAMEEQIRLIRLSLDKKP